MVLEVCHLPGCQFHMATHVLMYSRHVGDRAHSAWFSVREFPLPWVFCFYHLDPEFVADFSVNEVCCCC